MPMPPYQILVEQARVCDTVQMQATGARLGEAHLRQHARPVCVSEGPAQRVQRRDRARAAKAQHAQLAHLGRVNALT